MKRMISLMLALMLCLGVAAASSETVQNGVLFTTPYFTLTLPEGWQTDFEDLEKDDATEELGYAYAPESKGLAIGAFLMYVEELKDFSLWNTDDAGMQDFTDIMMDILKEDHPRFLGTVMAGQIPLVLLQGEDEDGPYVSASTVTNGYAIHFMGFVTDEQEEYFLELTEKDIELFSQILSTLQPVT